MAKIIEAKAIIRGEDQLGPLVDKLGKKFDHLAKGMKSGEGVDKMAGALGKVRAQLEAIEKFNASKIKFFGSRDNLRKAQADLERHVKTMAALGAGANTKAAASEQARLAAVVDRAARSFDQQRNAAMAARRALTDMGVPVDRAAAHQQKLAGAVERANRQLERQHKWRSRIAGVPAAAGAIAGAVTASRTSHFAGKAIVSAADFDIGTRKQRAFTDVSAKDQAEILTPQAKRIGQDTQFTNLDVVKAQTTAMQGLPSNITGRIKAEVAAGILENVKNYALVMEADLATSAEAIRSYLQATNKDISTKEKALAEANKATNQLVRMAKLGGMSDDDVQGYLKFAMPTASAAGVSPEAAMAIAALARRGGLRGDEAGVFMRSTASKLVAPTKKGITALNAAGIDYNKFIRMPNSLSVDKLESHFGNEIGTAFTPEVRARLAAALNDNGTVGDRSKFTETVTSIIADQFPKTKKGQISAADRQKIAKAAGGFHKVSAASVDAERLLDTVMMSNMTLAQLNAFLTDKHGGKGAITQRQRDEYVSARKSLQGVGDDPNFAKKKADEIMGGFGGEYERLKGSVETLTQSIGEASAETFKLKSVFAGAGASLDWIANLPKPVLAGGAAVAGVGAVGGAAWLTTQLAGGFGLSGSAVALDGAAAALTRAAVVLGGSGAAGAAGGATGAAGAAGVAGAAGLAANKIISTPKMAPYFAPWALATVGIATTPDVMSNYRGKSWADVMRDRMDTRGPERLDEWNKEKFTLGGVRSRLGLDQITAELKGSAEVKGEAKVTIDIPGVANRTVGVPLRGTLSPNGAGSLGVSSPDAGAMPIGVP